MDTSAFGVPARELTIEEIEALDVSTPEGLTALIGDIELVTARWTVEGI